MGETIVNDIEKNDNQTNSRFGAAFANKLNQNNSVKIAITSGISTHYGPDLQPYLSLISIYDSTGKI